MSTNNTSLTAKEQAALAGLEARAASDDPRLSAHLRGRNRWEMAAQARLALERVNTRLVAVVGLVLGLVLVVAGLAVSLIVSIVGLAVMTVGLAAMVRTIERYRARLMLERAAEAGPVDPDLGI